MAQQTVTQRRLTVKPGSGSGIVRAGAAGAAGGPGGAMTTVADGGGPVIGTVQVQLIFWGTTWGTAPAPPIAALTSSVRSMVTGPYMRVLGQYHGVQAGSLLPEVLVTTSDPPNPFANSDITNLITGLLSAGTLAEPDDDTQILYCVIVPAGVASNQAGIIGEHSLFTYSDVDPGGSQNVNAHYAWITHSGTLASVTVVFSHELVEACSDPEGSGIQLNAPGICSANPGSWCEIGDVCQGTDGVVNGVNVQSYWSQSDNACVVPRDLHVGLGHQVDMNQLDAIFIGANGALNVSWVSGDGAWQGPAAISPPGTAVAGTQVGVANQVDMNQLDAVFIGGDGALNVAWVSGDGAWQGPAAISGRGAATPGTAVALAHQVDMNQLDAVFIGSDGALNVAWVTAYGAWQGPVAISPPNASVPGGAVALACQVDNNQLDAVFIGSDGALNVAWVTAYGAWQGPVAISPPGTAVPGTAVALGHQVDNNQLDALFIGSDGALNVAWVGGYGAWQGPVAISPAGAASPGTAVAAGNQVDNNQLDALFIGGDGALNVAWVTAYGAWQGPVAISPAGAAIPGMPVAVEHQVDNNQLDALFVGSDGAVDVAWVGGYGAWQGPVAITPPGAV